MVQGGTCDIRELLDRWSVHAASLFCLSSGGVDLLRLGTALDRARVQVAQPYHQSVDGTRLVVCTVPGLHRPLVEHAMAMGEICHRPRLVELSRLHDRLWQAARARQAAGQWSDAQDDERDSGSCHGRDLFFFKQKTAY